MNTASCLRQVALPVVVIAGWLLVCLAGCDEAPTGAGEQAEGEPVEGAKCVVVASGGGTAPVAAPPSSPDVAAGDGFPIRGGETNPSNIDPVPGISAPVKAGPTAEPGFNPAALFPASSPQESSGSGTSTGLPPLDSPKAEKPTSEGATGRGSKAAIDDGKLHKISFDDIKLNMKKEDPFDRALITPKIESLEGKRVAIRGWIHPSVYVLKNIRRFILVRDNKECCFGPGAALYDCIAIEMDNAAAGANFTTRPVSVEGVFSIDEIPGPDGRPLAIYHLQASRAGE